MLSELRNLIAQRPFVPFAIHMASGEQIRVPTVDHIAVAPSGGRAIVFADDDRTIFVSLLLISQMTMDAQPASTQTA